MEKIIVIGCPGSGKSVFSRRLAEALCIPVTHLDNLYWNKDITTVPKEEFLARLRNAMSGDSWIIDGNYGSTMEMRMCECDTVFFLDLPTEVCIAGIKARRGKPRPDMPWIEQGDDAEFTAFVKNFRKDSRSNILELLEKHSEKDIYIFTSRAECDAFFGGL